MWWKLLAGLGLAQIITGTQGTIYLVRVFLTPMLPWGQLLLHVFYRGDEDPDPHDHHWNFATYPLRWGYTEEVMGHITGDMHRIFVPAGRWSHRDWAHCHRIVPELNRFPLWTLVWRGPDIPGLTWGFWLDTTRPGSEDWEDAVGWFYQTNPTVGNRIKIPWRTYLFKEKQREHI